MRPDGSQLTRLTTHPASDRDPAWLADGMHLTFASDRDQGFELYLLSASGGAPQRLTIARGDNLQPAARNGEAQ
jgi:TolB protein